eukprot:411246-Prorocentrum_minimum.AAC.1
MESLTGAGRRCTGLDACAAVLLPLGGLASALRDPPFRPARPPPAGCVAGLPALAPLAGLLARFSGASVGSGRGRRRPLVHLLALASLLRLLRANLMWVARAAAAEARRR